MEKTGYRPRFGYDIRIKREGDAPRAKPHARACAVPGCPEEGLFHVPISPKNMAERQWLCARHTREHNEKWDYFAGMSEADIARFQEEALTGHRPTWPLGKRAAGMHDADAFPTTGAYTIEDGYAVFRAGQVNPEPRRPLRVLTPLQRQAFDILGLEPSAALNEIKARYKELVKRFHPDANGGDRGAEERLKRVIKAYGVLRAAGLT